ncbi:hypothetical protein BRE01_28280 [Brevibacillus reuszeri]|uniref:Bacterial sugar transferase domain-containing protein n=2 Tax=Brevibacillus reuszeri TaxID=54915 RepID=A0A0K9YIX6_9BACL|nr:hypothetical protein ADS79_32145 [Brevibacillus reuszeri]GED69126.1 hypothetical protein BRE01_28280 [Brevibacillus reuszeri]
MEIVKDMELIPVNGLRSSRSFYASCLKNVLDFSFALLILLLLLPLLLLVAIAIWFDSSGPVLFRQKRVGKYGKEFTIYKFRTMYVDSPQEGVSPSAATDPRITRFGRILRKTSMDELPQLINILRGEMSFVGPRPEQKMIVEKVYSYYEKQRWLVKPGITGLWQISPDRNKPIHENLHHDFSYIQNLTFALDVKIVYKTIRVIVRSNTC